MDSVGSARISPSKKRMKEARELEGPTKGLGNRQSARVCSLFNRELNDAVRGKCGLSSWFAICLPSNDPEEVTFPDAAENAEIVGRWKKRKTYAATEQGASRPINRSLILGRSARKREEERGETFENRQGESSREIVEALSRGFVVSSAKEEGVPSEGKGEGEGVSEGDRAVFSLGLATRVERTVSAR